VAIWNSLWLFGGYFRFGTMRKEKSGNPERNVAEKNKALSQVTFHPMSSACHT
jgi:hypothetical protein